MMVVKLRLVCYGGKKYVYYCIVAVDGCVRCDGWFLE